MALTRGATTALLTALAGHFHPVLLTEADWPGELIRVNTNAVPITWNGATWLGAGKLVEFSGPAEQGGLATADASVRVAATLESMLAERGKIIRNRNITVWFGITTEQGGGVLAADPVVIFNGYFDSREFSTIRDGEDPRHDMLLGLGIGPAARASASITHGPEDQERTYPGDTAGRHVIHAIKRQANPPVWPEP
ncbi:hypothetical protein [Limimaricola cinnabarinus]|uniref:Uncharacterized protein n=1 Tax=Limimaricola cinnabarinus LL-001 TaxID=1337093 RepID=U2YKJ7_9RHOB|nr:hypothetical protein [Limimaricola cinnabarinus]GAD55496.1 hypothetical protein MBELCI_1548 [Limimaricola cinnabarinus LL-001]